MLKYLQKQIEENDSGGVRLLTARSVCVAGAHGADDALAKLLVELMLLRIDVEGFRRGDRNWSVLEQSELVLTEIVCVQYFDFN